MTSQKISELTPVTVLASGDYFPVVQASGVSNKRVGVDVLDVRYTSAASGTAAFDAAATALASGNAALVDVGAGQASGNAALVDSPVALASGNAALSTKYDKTGGPISGPIVVQSQAYGEIVGPVLISGGIELNLSTANNWDFVLGGETEFLNPTNISGGHCGVLTVRQDNIGSRTAAFSGYWNFPAGTPPTLTTTASGVDVLAYYCSSPTEIQVVYNLDFS